MKSSSDSMSDTNASCYRLSPRNALDCCGLTAVLADRGNPEALRLLQTAIEIEPAAVESDMKLTELDLAAGRPDQAFRALRNCLNTVPDSREKPGIELMIQRLTQGSKLLR